MQSIGQYYFIDRGWFDANPEVIYVNPNGNSGTTGGYGKQMDGQSITFDPGSNSDVQNGATVTLKIDVVAGSDNTAGESFLYESGNSSIANYAISGTTLNNTLKFLGVTTNASESAKLAADFSATVPQQK